MKWSDEKIEQLKSLAFSGVPNAEIAKRLDIPIEEVYGKRSQLGITIPKIKAAKAGTVNPEFEAALPNRVLENQFNDPDSRQAPPKPVPPKKRTTGEISHDLRIQLRALSNALDESHILIVELLDVLGLLD
jgi:hypothetical protein